MSPVTCRPQYWVCLEDTEVAWSWRLPSQSAVLLRTPAPFPLDAAGEKCLHRLLRGPKGLLMSPRAGEDGAVRWAGRTLCLQSVDAPVGLRPQDGGTEPVRPHRASLSGHCGKGRQGSQTESVGELSWCEWGSGWRYGFLTGKLGLAQRRARRAHEADVIKGGLLRRDGLCWARLWESMAYGRSGNGEMGERVLAATSSLALLFVSSWFSSISIESPFFPLHLP